MKRNFCIVLLTSLLFLSSCSSETLVGKWQLVRTNKFAQDTWLKSENETFEFFNDGRWKFNGPGGSDEGTYTTDTNVIPHRYVLKGSLIPRGIYKIEGNKLILKANAMKDQFEFPSDFGIHVDCIVMELERK
jgi:hypothetical protein